MIPHAPHQHRHTPCARCTCRLEPFPDGSSQCNGARCPECPPVPACFGMAMTEGERDLRGWRATHPRLQLAQDPAVTRRAGKEDQ